MEYNQRKIVKKLQIALRRLILKDKLSDKHLLIKYLGRSKEGLIKYVENKFIGNMNWSNFAISWEFAHVIPVNYFDHTKDEDLKVCWNYRNIIPMFKEDNKNFGSCILFAEKYFNNIENKSIKHIEYIKDKLYVYDRYMGYVEHF